MPYSINLFLIALLAISSCTVQTHEQPARGSKDGVQNNQSTLDQALKTKMTINDTIWLGAPIELKLMVRNNSNAVLQFSKWHTPFEPLMSKYIEVKDENGKEINYLGARAKRIYPPPENSYIKVYAGEQISAIVNLDKAYEITEPAKYFIVYTKQGINGLTIEDRISLFTSGKTTISGVVYL